MKRHAVGKHYLVCKRLTNTLLSRVTGPSAGPNIWPKRLLSSIDAAQSHCGSSLLSRKWHQLVSQNCCS